MRVAPPTFAHDLTLLQTAPVRSRLDQFLGRNHLGGTMFPNQWTPKLTTTFLEIEEHFGGFSFGGGNGNRSRCDRVRLGLRLSRLAFIAHSSEWPAWNYRSLGTSHIFSRCRRGQC
jgi:hypothetical protein